MTTFTCWICNGQGILSTTGERCRRCRGTGKLQSLSKEEQAGPGKKKKEKK